MPNGSEVPAAIRAMNIVADSYSSRLSGLNGLAERWGGSYLDQVTAKNESYLKRRRMKFVHRPSSALFLHVQKPSRTCETQPSKPHPAAKSPKNAFLASNANPAHGKMNPHT